MLDAAALIPSSCWSGIAPSGAETVMPSPVNVPPSTGVKTAYDVPAESVSDVGISPAGLIGSGVGSAVPGALVTRTVNVAMHGARSLSVSSNRVG